MTESDRSVGTVPEVGASGSLRRERLPSVSAEGDYARGGRRNGSGAMLRGMRSGEDTVWAAASTGASEKATVGRIALTAPGQEQAHRQGQSASCPACRRGAFWPAGVCGAETRSAATSVESASPPTPASPQAISTDERPMPRARSTASTRRQASTCSERRWFVTGTSFAPRFGRLVARTDVHSLGYVAQDRVAEGEELPHPLISHSVVGEATALIPLH